MLVLFLGFLQLIGVCADVGTGLFIARVQRYAVFDVDAVAFFVNVPNAIMVYNSSLVKTQEEEIASKLRELSRVEQTEEVMKEQDALLVKMQKVAELRKKIAERLGRVL